MKFRMYQDKNSNWLDRSGYDLKESNCKQLANIESSSSPSLKASRSLSSPSSVSSVTSSNSPSPSPSSPPFLCEYISNSHSIDQRTYCRQMDNDINRNIGEQKSADHRFLPDRHVEFNILRNGRGVIQHSPKYRLHGGQQDGDSLIMDLTRPSNVIQQIPSQGVISHHSQQYAHNGDSMNVNGNYSPRHHSNDHSHNRERNMASSNTSAGSSSSSSEHMDYTAIPSISANNLVMQSHMKSPPTSTINLNNYPHFSWSTTTISSPEQNTPSFNMPMMSRIDSPPSTLIIPTMKKKKRKPQPIPEMDKDESYWERRKRNNESAKRSREVRRAKEYQTTMKVIFLEQENLKLKTEVNMMRNEIETLRDMLRERRTN